MDDIIGAALASPCNALSASPAVESIFLAINDGSYYAAARPTAAAAATAVPRPPYELNRSYALCRLLHATMNSNIKTDTNSALNNSVENSTSPELSFTSHSAQKVISETFKLSLSLRFTLKKHNLTHKRKTRTKKLNEINTKKLQRVWLHYNARSGNGLDIFLKSKYEAHRVQDSRARHLTNK